MWVALEALDTWFCREGGSFEAGDGAYRVGSVFPPPATTIQGALRARILADHGFTGIDTVRDAFARARAGDVVKRLGGPGSVGELSLTGPYVCVALDTTAPRLLLPAPSDLFVADKGAGVTLAPAETVPPEVRAAPPVGAAPLPNEWRGPRLLRAAQGGGSPEEYWIEPGELERYLAGSACTLRRAELALADPRTGLEIVPGTRLAKTGRLYTAEHRRPCPGVGVAVRVDGIDDLLRGSAHPAVRLGGESRAATVRELPNDTVASFNALLAAPPPALRDAIARTRRVKLYLASSAVFAGGWCPDFVDPATGRTRSPCPRATLAGAAVPKPRVVSGYDMVHRTPRPARLAVPAGAVYHFTLDDDSDAEAFLEYVSDPATLAPLDGDRRLGFGRCCIGTWHPA